MTTTEAVRPKEFGPTTQVYFEPENALVHKKIRQLPNYDGGWNDIPAPEDYQRLVGGSIKFLNYPG